MSEYLEPPEDDDVDFEPPDEAEGLAQDAEAVDWGGGELEEAYLKAMMALEASEAELPDILDQDPPHVAEHESSSQNERSNNVGSSTSSASQETAAKTALAELVHDQVAVPSEKPNSEPAADVRLTPRQILEACLFVGGTPLASGKLAGILRGDFESDFIDREIDELNRLYAAENRPYEIRLGEGGYRLTLRDEFERIRYKVYGLGPKEVRLSQEALEVLAIVAYHQPIRQSGVEELGKPNCGAVLRQLVRRELLAVERDAEHPRDVNYKTTTRFLSLFGIRNLEELPRHEQIGYK